MPFHAFRYTFLSQLNLIAPSGAANDMTIGVLVKLKNQFCSRLDSKFMHDAVKWE